MWSPFEKLQVFEPGWVYFSLIFDSFLIDLIAYLTLIETAQQWKRLKIDLLLLVTSMTYSSMRRRCRKCVGDMLVCPNPLEEQHDLKHSSCKIRQIYFFIRNMHFAEHTPSSPSEHLHTHQDAASPIVFLITFAWFSCDNTVRSYIWRHCKLVEVGMKSLACISLQDSI